MTLTFTIQEAMEIARERDARDAGVGPSDIEASRRTGIDARDVRTLREASARGLLVVVRCPKTTARAWHGLLPGKNGATAEKTGASGVVVTGAGRMMVSDYDLMCIWKHEGGGLRKIFVSAPEGRKTGPWPAESVATVRGLNQRLVTRIQHGCQDDFLSPKNPGVKEADHFAGFHNGKCEPLANPAACAAYYERVGIPWPYDAGGRFLGSAG